MTDNNTKHSQVNETNQDIIANQNEDTKEEKLITSENRNKNSAKQVKEKSKQNQIPNSEVTNSKDKFSSTTTTGSKVNLDEAQRKMADMLQRMNVAQLLSGGNDNRRKKDMSEHKFWSTQPVASHDEKVKELGPIEDATPQEKLRQDPLPLPKDFEWTIVDVDDDVQVQELHELLSNHYVEDDDESFRFRYSVPFLKWALKPPGYETDYHIGVRVTSTRRLVGFISGIPVTLRVRDQILKQVEINFLCVHKKLRNKRLAPVLIKEVTRRCNLKGIFQALYTAGAVLPKPISTCRYYHRSLNPKKLVEIGFSRVPKNLTLAGLIKLNKVPTENQIENVREMEDKDVKKVNKLLSKYMEKFDLVPIMTDEEIQHWFCSGDSRIGQENQIAWSYVVEDIKTGEITDFFSFYSLPSTILGNKQYNELKAAYLFYYATDAAWNNSTGEHIKDYSKTGALSTRLNKLAMEISIMATKNSFDVLNALTLMDNPLFLEAQKFGPGDGFLNYYLFNYKCPAIRGGVKSMPETPNSRAVMPIIKDEPEGNEGGIAVVML